MSNWIGILFPDNEKARQVGAGIASELTNLGYEVAERYAGDASEQAQYLNDLLAGVCDLLIFWALPGSNPEESLQEDSFEYGVIAFEEPIYHAGAVKYYVSFDFYEAGARQAEYILSNVEDADNFTLGLFTVQSGNTKTEELFTGLKETFDNNGISVDESAVETIAGVEKAGAKARMSVLLSENGNTYDAIWCCTDDMAEGVVEAYAEEEISVADMPIVASFGGSSEMLGNIAAGLQAVTLMPDYDTATDLAVEVADRLLNEQDIDDLTEDYISVEPDGSIPFGKIGMSEEDGESSVEPPEEPESEPESIIMDNVGEINLDLLNRINYRYAPPFVYYTHELPLLSFGDVQHTVNLSLVFNFGNYRDEKYNNKNPFFIAPGYKLNLQKRLLENEEDDCMSFQEGDGKIVNLIQKSDNVFVFDDESQRILRRTEQSPNQNLVSGGNADYGLGNAFYDYTVEYADFRKEKYDESGRITEAFDKYSDDAVLSYAYNENGQLAAITFRDSKVISLEYESNRLKYVKYNNKAVEFFYNADGTLDRVEHYTGVTYKFNMYKADFALIDVDFGYKVTALANGTTVLRSKELNVASDKKTIEIIDKNGNHTVNKVSYRNPDILVYENPPFEYVDIIDNNGVETRVQFDLGKESYAYEIKNGQPQFLGDTPQSRFAGNVTFYNVMGAPEDNPESGVQTINSGMALNYNATNYEWSGNHESGERAGFYIISGWIKLNSSDSDSAFNCCATICIGNSSSCDVTYEVNLTSEEEWKYFSCKFCKQANILCVGVTTPETVSLRDVRVVFQERGASIDDNNVAHTNMYEYVLLGENEEIFFDNARFYYTSNNINYEIKSDLEPDRIVTFSDVLRYKLRKKREGVSDEVYYNKCQDIIGGTTDLKVLYNGSYISIDNFDLGVVTYSNGKKSVTSLAINENSANAAILKTSTVDGSVVSTEKLDRNLDVTESTVEGVTTQYVRNSQGLVTRESVSGLYRQDISYTDTLITVMDVNPVTHVIISTTKYYLDTVWGGVYKVEMPDGSVVTDIYDEAMSVLTARNFDNNETRRNIFSYSDGRLASMTGGALNYGFGYADTGELASVSKNAASVENHAYDRQNGETTVTSSYPDSTGALYTETKVFDQYGRLKSIDGVLENLYDLDAYWYYSYDGSNQRHTSMENYGVVQGFELNHGTIVKDGKDALLAKTTDKLAGEVTKYGYANEKLTAAVTYDESDDTILKVDTFVYDIAGRLIKTRFDYNPLSGEYVTSEIGYLKEADDPLADNTVNCYSYKVNGTEKAKTENTYDAYKRIKNKKYTVDGKVFTKGIEYDKTRVKKVVDSAGGTTSYEYDCMGRISIEKDADNSILKSYVYDSYGQLIRENNKSLDKTFVYEYNTIGNIVTVKTYNYTTGSLGTVIAQQNFSYDSTHPDRLSNCGGGSTSYNGMGCPVTYNGYSVSWSRCKLSRLSQGSLSEGIHDYYFSYNAFGQRTHRSYTYNLPTSEPFEVALGMVMNYSQEFCYDQAGRLICERKFSEYYQSPSISDKIVYLYDADSIIGIVYTENGETDTYYFQRNLFGDVVGIYDVNGTKVGGYAYDAWGNCTITLNTKSVVTRNPIRYRGYYYDQDTGLYYLNARYYSPEWRRFISPDDTAYLDSETPNGLNLYAYCGNNPVNRYDPSGYFWDYIFDGVFLVWSIVDVIKNPDNWKNWVALGIDLVFAVVPFVPSAAGQVIKVGNKIDNASDVANMINKLDNISDIEKLTLIGRNMNRVTDTAKAIGKADNLYEVWKGYDMGAKGLKKLVHNGISMAHDGAWLFGKLRKGYTVIDIGITTTMKGIKAFGLWYGTERVVLSLWKMRNLWKLLLNYFL